MKNWKTSAAGILGLLAIAATQASFALDNDPSTVANWSLVIAAIPVAIGLLFAKDSNVTGGTVNQ